MSASIEPVLRFSDVGHDRDGEFKRPISGLNFSLAAGEAAVMTGPLGCGKSMLLRMVIGSQRPTEGQVLVEGRDPAALQHSELEQLRTRVGFMPENGALLSNLNLFENLVLPLRYHVGPSEEDVRRVAAETLELLGIGALPQATPPTSTRSLCQMVALGRALILRPPLLVLDSPVLGMDEPTARGVWQTLDRLTGQLGVAILIAADFPPQQANLRHALVDLGKQAQPWELPTRPAG